MKRVQQLWGAVIERGPIDPVPTDTEIGHGSTQIGTQFPQKSDDLGMPL